MNSTKKLAGVGINFLVEFIALLGDIQNKVTMGSVLALWLLNIIYMLLLRWFVFQPLSLRLQRLSLTYMRRESSLIEN